MAFFQWALQKKTGGRAYQRLALGQEMHWGRQGECFQWPLSSVVPADMHLGKNVGFEVWDITLRL